MRKVIFMALLASVAFCEEPEVKEEEKLLTELIADELKKDGICCPFSIRGTFNFTALSRKQDQKSEPDEDNAIVALESDVFLKYLGKGEQCNFGCEVGAKVNSGIMKQGSPIVRTAYAFVESEKIGLLKVGFTPTVADSMTINGGSVMVGYGGAASRNLSLFYNESAGSFVDLCFPFDDNKAAKLAFMSAKFSGVTVGISFTPDSRSTNPFKTLHPKPRNPEISEEKANFPGIRSAYSKNIITAGVAYEFGDPQAFNGKIALNGWIGKGKTSVIGVDVEDIRAYNVGVILGYKDFKLALGYADHGKSLRSKKYATADVAAFDENRNYAFADADVGLKPGANAGKIYSIGASYDVTARFVASVGYFRSVVKFSGNEKCTADVITVAGEYTIHRGAIVYAEYNRLKSDSCARAQAYGKACGLSSTGKNSANIFMIGVKINI
ncbi:MAG: porin [Holosporaceae bacterium]|jgi:hypothetical protein|nr:porin [Holosporaceae bacterium]